MQGSAVQFSRRASGARAGGTAQYGMARWAVTQGPAGSGVTGSLLFSSVLWKRGLQESASPFTLLSREAKEVQGAAPLFSIVRFQQSCISALLPGQRLTVAALGLPLMPPQNDGKLRNFGPA